MLITALILVWLEVHLEHRNKGASKAASQSLPQWISGIQTGNLGILSLMRYLTVPISLRSVYRGKVSFENILDANTFFENLSLKIQIKLWQSLFKVTL